MMPNKDMLGRKFKPGQTVVYPYRRGSQLVMRTGTILQTDLCSSLLACSYHNCKIIVLSPDGKDVKLTRLDNVVVVGVKS